MTTGSQYSSCVIFFFFNDTATTEIYTLSLHDALPIWPQDGVVNAYGQAHDVPNLFVSDASQFTTGAAANPTLTIVALADRKSTRLNSSHANISYAVFCLKKKKINKYRL